MMTETVAVPKRRHRPLRNLGIGLGVIAVIVVGVPFLAAGTVDPCEAAARVFVKRSGPPQSTAFGVFGDAMAVNLGATYLRSQGSLVCYGMLGKALTQDFSPPPPPQDLLTGPYPRDPTTPPPRLTRP